MKYFTLVAVFLGLVAVASACGGSSSTTAHTPSTKNCPNDDKDKCHEKQQKCDVNAPKGKQANAEGAQKNDAKPNAKKAKDAAENVQ
jgi:hypothetical protein